jgi:hypothetical protein
MVEPHTTTCYSECTGCNTSSPMRTHDSHHLASRVPGPKPEVPLSTCAFQRPPPPSSWFFFYVLRTTCQPKRGRLVTWMARRSPAQGPHPSLVLLNRAYVTFLTQTLGVWPIRNGQMGCTLRAKNPSLYTHVHVYPWAGNRMVAGY